MNTDVTPKQLRSFGLLVGAIFAVIGLWPALWQHQEPLLWALVLAGLLIVPALVFPRSLRRVYQAWMALGAGMGWINTRIILSVLFYGLMTPMGLLMRLRGKDPMRRRWEPAVETYRVMRQPRPNSHMIHQF
jgi:Saxitoxin biosynthesis operon protein SxtJ